jgi:hypothetical protein
MAEVCAFCDEDIELRTDPNGSERYYHTDTDQTQCVAEDGPNPGTSAKPAAKVVEKAAKTAERKGR